mgnify:CR=1 FL=1
MKKKFLIIIAIIILILLGIIGYYVFIDMQQEEKLETELTEISNLTNAETIDIDAINETLKRTVTTGDYAVVEQAFKQYLKDNFDNSIQIAEILNDEKITNLLTVENYKADGKEFVETKNYIASTRDTLENCKNKYTEFFTEEKAMSYINDKGLDSYYIDLYKQKYVGDIETENNDKTVENAIDEIISILNKSEEVINFLIENQNSWEIRGENIVFNSESLSDEYDQLVENVLE